MQENDIDFRGILALLNESSIRYVLIGGGAMIAQGSLYSTRDLDIFSVIHRISKL